MAIQEIEQRRKTAWVLTDGKIGMLNQALGLAEAVAAAMCGPAGSGLALQRKTLRPAAPWRWLPPLVWPIGLTGKAVMGAGSGGDPLQPPWPDLLVTCGRHAVGPSLAIGRLSGGRTFRVHIQHPHVDPRRFDLVVAPAHDRLDGPNVMVTAGAVHRVTPAKLEAAAERLRPAAAHLPAPRVAVLIGGSNKVYRLDRAAMDRLAQGLARVAREQGAGLLVTPSRRTGAENEAVLRERLAGLSAAIWDGIGENPYFGYLGLADAIVVTADSVNMVSEAASTGKPVHVFALNGGAGDDKFERFHRGLREAGVTRPFTGQIESWRYRPLDDTARVAGAIRTALERRG